MSEQALSYRTENLSYTKRGMVILSFWLLWGDFAFQFFESIFSRFLPLFLKELHASNMAIGLMTGSLAGLVNILFLPFISQWSDNLRTSYGRRIPILAFTAPLTALFLIAIGLAPEIGGWLYDQLLHRHFPGISRIDFIVWFLGALAIGYHFFNMVLVNAYNWLIRDVVPLGVMSRFLACFSIVGTISGTLFLWFVFPHLGQQRREIFMIVGLFYPVVFLSMCFKVREGTYPPPVIELSSSVSNFRLYFHDCLRVPLYRNFFIVFLLVTAALSCSNSFIILFASNMPGLSMDDIGKIFATTSAVSLFFFYPIGWLCDRLTPMHVAVFAIAMLSVSSLLAFFCVRTPAGFLAYSLVFAFPNVAWQLSQRATSMKLFPAKRFGQFSSGLNVFGCGALIFGNILIGALMDFFHSDYRTAFIWACIISATAVYPMACVLAGWKLHGGASNYYPPLSES